MVFFRGPDWMGDTPVNTCFTYLWIVDVVERLGTLGDKCALCLVIMPIIDKTGEP